MPKTMITLSFEEVQQLSKRQARFWKTYPCSEFLIFGTLMVRRPRKHGTLH